MRSINYSLEVLVAGRPAKEYFHPETKDTFIEGRKGSEYTIRFTNHTPGRVLVIPSVDGLSVVDGKPAGTESRGYVVSAYATIDIPGWRVDGEKVRAFQFRPQSEKDSPTYVEALKSEGFDVDTGNQGVIGVMVFKERYTPYVYPKLSHIFYETNPFGPNLRSVSISNMSLSSSNAGGSWESVNCSYSASASATKDFVNPDQNFAEEQASLGTGMGEEVSFTTVDTTFRRATSEPDKVMVLQYDTIQGLKKRGVIVDQPKTAAHRAFPTYSTGCYIPKNM